jgi:hypothetical protein
VSDNQRIHEITIKRETDTPNAIGGVTRSWTTAARGSLPTVVRGRAIRMNPKERIDNGIRGEKQGWKILVWDEDPQIELTDRVFFDYVDGESHEVKVLVASHARSANEAFWKALGEEDTTEG